MPRRLVIEATEGQPVRRLRVSDNATGVFRAELQDPDTEAVTFNGYGTSAYKALYQLLRVYAEVSQRNP